MPALHLSQVFFLFSFSRQFVYVSSSFCLKDFSALKETELG